MQREQTLETLRVIVEQTKARGFPPTMREIAAVVGLHPTSVLRRIQTLLSAGLVESDGTPRSVIVTEAGRRLVTDDT